MLSKQFLLPFVMLITTILAVDQEVPSEKELPVEGFVVGGPKSSVGQSSGQAVAEKATNKADSVQTFEDQDFAEALKDPYRILFGQQVKESVWQVCTESNATVISGTNSSAVEKTLCHRPARS